MTNKPETTSGRLGLWCVATVSACCLVTLGFVLLYVAFLVAGLVFGIVSFFNDPGPMRF